MKNCSIIIPALNEEKLLGKVLKHIRDLTSDAEIIIADGGSTDNTINIAEQFNVKVIRENNGRGAQLNKGVIAATHEILLFLHADTFLPENTFLLIKKYFSDDKINVANFRLKFDSNNYILKFYECFTRFDSFLSNFGDQTIIVRKSFFNMLGGFSEMPIFEDVDFFKRARKKTKIYKLPAAVVTSARRFYDVGIIKTQLLNGWFFLKYMAGTDPKILHHSYFKIKKNKTENAIIIFAKYPEKGKVKTRLAENTGDEFAALLYKLFAENIFEQVSKILNDKTACYLFFNDKKDREKVADWINHDFILLPQHGEDLGEKIADAFRKVFETGVKKAVIVGTDVPDITGKTLLSSFEYLNNFDTVISPASDGGYSLLGLNHPFNKLFEDIEWSTSSVLSKTLEQAKSLNLKIKLLAELPDIDTEAGLKQWLSDTNSGNTALKEKIRLIQLERSL